MIEGLAFIALSVVAVVELVKRAFEKDAKGVLIILGAAFVGLLVGVFDTQLGIPPLTPAQGIMAGLDAVGLHTVARQVG